MIHEVKPYIHHLTGMSRTFKDVSDMDKRTIFTTIRLRMAELAGMIENFHIVK